jgi:cytochrome c oxidase assembly protein subunit 15
MALGALLAQCAITITGAAVRLSGSGLGCDDWPNCNATSLVDVSSPHSRIEQINRLFTGAVAVAVVLAVLGALWREPRRRDLTWLALAVALGVPAQAVVGGIVVKTDLHPAATQMHMVLSLVLIGLATVLVRRAGEPDGVRREPRVRPQVERAVRALTVICALALATGTLVTGSGPHAGDERAKRFPFEIPTVARIHSITVLTALGVALVLVCGLRTRERDRAVLDRALATWMTVACAQAVLGYAQYLTEVPALLVGFHVAGAVMFWIATVHLWLATRSAQSPPAVAAATLPGVTAGTVS